MKSKSVLLRLLVLLIVSLETANAWDIGGIGNKISDTFNAVNNVKNDVAKLPGKIENVFNEIKHVFWTITTEHDYGNGKKTIFSYAKETFQKTGDTFKKVGDLIESTTSEVASNGSKTIFGFAKGAFDDASNAVKVLTYDGDVDGKPSVFKMVKGVFNDITTMAPQLVQDKVIDGKRSILGSVRATTGWVETIVDQVTEETDKAGNPTLLGHIMKVDDIVLSLIPTGKIPLFDMAESIYNEFFKDEDGFFVHDMKDFVEETKDTLEKLANPLNFEDSLDHFLDGMGGECRILGCVKSVIDAGKDEGVANFDLKIKIPMPFDLGGKLCEEFEDLMGSQVVEDFCEMAAVIAKIVNEPIPTHPPTEEVPQLCAVPTLPAYPGGDFYDDVWKKPVRDGFLIGANRDFDRSDANQYVQLKMGQVAVQHVSKIVDAIGLLDAAEIALYFVPFVAKLIWDVVVSVVDHFVEVIDVHDALIDGAEIEAAYENTASLMEDTCNILQDLDDLKKAVAAIEPPSDRRNLLRGGDDGFPENSTASARLDELEATVQERLNQFDSATDTRLGDMGGKMNVLDGRLNQIEDSLSVLAENLETVTKLLVTLAAPEKAAASA